MTRSPAAPSAASRRHLASWAALCLWVGAFAATGSAADRSAADHPATGDDLPEAAEYAYGFPIAAPGSATLYRVELPLSFYRSTHDPELRDCGVYNTAGHPVPRVVAPPPLAERQPAARRPVPFYGLSRAESRAPADRLRLILESRGTRLRVETPSDPAAAPEPPGDDLDAYIVELGKDDEEPRATIVALHLTWPPIARNFVGRVEVEASDDLSAWQPLGGGSVADLRQDGGRIERRSVELSPTRARYLRLRWHGLPGGWSLAAIEAEEASGVKPETRRWAELAPRAAEAPEDGWVFDLAGSPPVDRLSLELPDDNTVVRARIFTWDPARSGWISVHRGLFYRLRQEGDSLVSGPAAFPPRRTSRFRVVIESGRIEGEWALRVGWRPDALVFVAQGEGPYRLVAGRALDEPEGFPQARLLGDRGILDLVDDGGYGSATLGERFELAGAASLERPQPVRWRVWGLWAVLIAGVLGVGAMAWRLLREGPAGD